MASDLRAMASNLMHALYGLTPWCPTLFFEGWLGETSGKNFAGTSLEVEKGIVGIVTHPERVGV